MTTTASLSPVFESTIFIAVSSVVLIRERKELNSAVFRALWPIICLIFLFFASAYTNISSPAGPAEKYYSIYYHFFGVISIWDIGLATVLLAVLMKKKLFFSFGYWQGLPALFLLLVLIFCAGLMHSSAGISPFGPSEFRRVLIAFTGPVYMISIYLLVKNLITNQMELKVILNFLKSMVLALAIYALLRFFLILTGTVQTMWLFALPVIIYDRLIFFYIPVFIWLINALTGEIQKTKILTFIAITGLFLILISTRRLNLLIICCGIFISLAGTGFLMEINIRKSLNFSRKFILLPIIGIIALSFVVPRSLTKLISVVKSLDLYSQTGRHHSGEMRIAESRNLLANLESRRYALLTGYGYGTFWQQKQNQPLDPLTKKIRPFGNWFSQFHLPYISIFYRFGLLGTSVFLIWYFSWFANIVGRLKRTCPKAQVFALSAFVFLMLLLPATLDSLNPTSWICCGGIAAILEKLLCEDINHTY